MFEFFFLFHLLLFIFFSAVLSFLQFFPNLSFNIKIGSHKFPVLNSK